MTKKIFFLLVFTNIYFITHLFFGENNIFNFFKYRENIKILNVEKINLLKQRYKIEQLSILLSDQNKDNNDVLEELLRQSAQASLPNEKIVIMRED